MGNYISCSLTTPFIKYGKAARVVLPGCEIRQFREPIKAAELMLECPGFFLVNSRGLNIGRRFSALAADEELELGDVYVMFPMRRLSSVVTAADMAVIFMAANSAAKRLSGENSDRIREESLKGEENGGSELGDLEGTNEGFPAAEMKFRLAMCRSRKPSLETIKEEPVSVRSRWLVT